MRLVVHKLWAYLGLHAPECWAPCMPGMPASPVCRSFIHHYGRTVTQHATHELERKAVAAASGPAGAKAYKLLARFKLLLLTGTLLTMILKMLHDIVALLLSTPRTARICIWAVRAGLSYKALKTRHTDVNSEAYIDELGALHTQWAQALARVCRANGGIYVKVRRCCIAIACRTTPGFRVQGSGSSYGLVLGLGARCMFRACKAAAMCRVVRSPFCTPMPCLPRAVRAICCFIRCDPSRVQVSVTRPSPS